MKKLFLSFFLFSFYINAYSKETEDKTLSSTFDAIGIKSLEEKVRQKKNLNDPYALKFEMKMSPLLQNDSYSFSNETAASKNIGLSVSFETSYDYLFGRLESEFSSGKLSVGTPSSIYFKNGESVKTYSVGMTFGVFYQKYYLGFGFLPYDRLNIHQFSSYYTSEVMNEPILVTQNLNLYGSSWNISFAYKCTDKINIRALYEKHSYTTTMAHYDHYDGWSSTNVYIPDRLDRTSLKLSFDYSIQDFIL